MLKLVLHILVAAGLWFGIGALEIAVPWRLGAIILGAIAVHLVWERLIFNPYLYLGAMAVADDDPIMLEAREKAKATLPLFLETIFLEHRKDSMVKFRFQTSSGQVENLWADLVEASDAKLEVYIRTLPVQHDQPLERTREIDVADVIDWQVEDRDGTILGGYTNRAVLAIYERQEGHLHPKLRPLPTRFRDARPVAAPSESTVTREAKSVWEQEPPSSAQTVSGRARLRPSRCFIGGGASGSQGTWPGGTICSSRVAGCETYRQDGSGGASPSRGRKAARAGPRGWPRPDRWPDGGRP